MMIMVTTMMTMLLSAVASHLHNISIHELHSHGLYYILMRGEWHCVCSPHILLFEDTVDEIHASHFLAEHSFLSFGSFKQLWKYHNVKRFGSLVSGRM